MTTVATAEQLNDQSVLSIAWTQASGEYAATAYQAFNAAKAAFDQALADGVTNPAVSVDSVDIDETLLNNNAYEAGLIGSMNRFPGADFG